MDKILIRDLPLQAIIGVRDAERNRRQRVTADVTLELDLKEAARSDSLAATVDYSQVEEELKRLGETSSFQLLEALAGAMIAQVLRHPPVRAVTVRLEKPGAARYGRSVVVEMTRRRGEDSHGQ